MRGESGHGSRDDVDAGVSAVASTLRELGERLDEWAVRGAPPAGSTPLGPLPGDGLLMTSLAMDAVLDTNSTVRQRSLREFLR